MRTKEFITYLGRYRILSAITNPTGKNRFDAGRKGKTRKSNATHCGKFSFLLFENTRTLFFPLLETDWPELVGNVKDPSS